MRPTRGRRIMPFIVGRNAADYEPTFRGIGPLAIEGAGITVAEVAGTSNLNNFITTINVNNYHKKCKHIRINYRMYKFKQ